MTLKDLKALRYHRREIEDIRERMTRLRATIEDGRKAILTGMPHSAQQRDRMAEYIVKLETLREKLLSRWVDMETGIAAAMEWIDTLPPDEGEVMRLRYVQGLTWREVERKAGYAENGATAYRIQRRALRKLPE